MAESWQASSNRIRSRVSAHPPGPDDEAMSRCAHRLAQLTLPLGGLGQIEHVVLRLAGITGQHLPVIGRPRALIFAGDHGIADAGVSAYAPDVTEQMAVNVAMGTAVAAVLARQAGADVRVWDVGVRTPVRHPAVVVAKVAKGTGNIAQTAAMSTLQAQAAFVSGMDAVQQAHADQVDLIVIGELGIGNTTVAAALACRLLGLAPEAAVGRGTGVDDVGLARKCALVAQALRLHDDARAPWDVMARLGGFELAAMAGAIVEAVSLRVPVLIDGVTTTVAALWAERLWPGLRAGLLASHQSPEPAHAPLLNALGVEPLLALGLRIGEGSGALFALPLLRQACAIAAETATFADARVSNPHQVGAEMQRQHAPAAGAGTAGEQSARAPVVQDFTEAERAAVYKVIAVRRDIRVFLPDPIPADVLGRILWAGHHAPSVGFMQPWNFIAVSDKHLLARLQAVVERERVRAAALYEDERQGYYLRLKVEGILQAPVTVCVTLDRGRAGPHVLGRNTMPETDLMSTSCAIENMWLAARAESIALGWVSIYERDDVREILEIPKEIDPCALLTLGYTPHFPDIPVLERAGWRKRLRLQDLVYDQVWGRRT